MAFRKLTAAEIECRVSTVSAKGCSLLLYKDARVDQNLLDETYGIFGWQRKHELIDGQLFCTVSVKNPENGEWVSKQDVGTESYTEKEKGRASDSFKRACFNIGIGRELYTAPFIWVSSNDCEVSEKNGKWTTYDKFKVKDIGYDESGNINKLIVVNAKTFKTVYEYGNKSTAKSEPKEEAKSSKNEMKDTEKVLIDETKQKALEMRCKDKGVSVIDLLDKCHLKSLADVTEKQFFWLAHDNNWEKLMNGK